MIKKIYYSFRNFFLYLVIFSKYKFRKNIKIDKQNRLFNKFELSLSKTCQANIGKNVNIKKNCSIRCRDHALLSIGNNVFMNNNVIITCRKKIYISDDVIIGPNVIIFDNDHNYKSNNMKNEYICNDVYIGKNVWIGANSCILKGTIIEDNCVISAGSVVTGKIPKNSIYYNKENIKEIGGKNV